MNNDIRKEYLHTILPRYRNASKSEKMIILDEFCSVCHYNRKYAIRLLNGTRSGFTPRKPAKRGPKTIYSHPDLLKILKHLWRLTNLPCSKRLKALIPLWLPFYPYYLGESLTHELLTISAATIDRLMKPMRSKFNKLGLSSTKPGSILSKHIPVKTGQWNEAIPGYLEADTIDVILLGEETGIHGGDRVTSQRQRIRVPVGPDLLGRVINPLGAPLDDLPAIQRLLDIEHRLNTVLVAQEDQT